MNANTQLVLDALHAEQERTGWPVHVRTLCQLTGLKSPASVHDHLRRLIASGLVEGQRSGFRATVTR